MVYSLFQSSTKFLDIWRARIFRPLSTGALQALLALVARRLRGLLPVRVADHTGRKYPNGLDLQFLHVGTCRLSMEFQRDPTKT